jgi:hypothetical protein
VSSSSSKRLVALLPSATAQRLEGSRFGPSLEIRLIHRNDCPGREMCRAGGSRERLDVRQFYGPLYPRNRIEAMGKTVR